MSDMPPLFEIDAFDDELRISELDWAWTKSKEVESYAFTYGWVRASDARNLVAEITNLRARVEVLEKHLGLMIANNLTGSFESEGLATDRAVSVLPNWEEKATGRTRLQWDAAAEIVNLHVEEAKR